MKFLYGTGNSAKLEHMKRMLDGLDIDIISFDDINSDIPDVKETGCTPIENACIKAKDYFKAFGIPVFSCDSGLYFENLPDFLSPKVNVRNVNGRYLTDEEMIDYYGGLAAKHGDITASYRNAICLVYDKEHIFTDFNEDLSGSKFIICGVPHKKRVKGFPLDSLSKRIDTNEYYYDTEHLRINTTITGFRRFFTSVLEYINQCQQLKQN